MKVVKADCVVPVVVVTMADGGYNDAGCGWNGCRSFIIVVEGPSGK